MATSKGGRVKAAATTSRPTVNGRGRSSSTAKRKPRSLEARVRAQYRKAIKEFQMWSTIALWALIVGYIFGHSAINSYLITLGCKP